VHRVNFGGKCLERELVGQETTSVANLQLTENIRNVEFHGPLCNGEHAGDVFIGLTPHQQLKYFSLAPSGNARVRAVNPAMPST